MKIVRIDAGEPTEPIPSVTALPDSLALGSPLPDDLKAALNLATFICRATAELIGFARRISKRSDDTTVYRDSFLACANVITSEYKHWTVIKGVSNELTLASDSTTRFGEVNAHAAALRVLGGAMNFIAIAINIEQLVKHAVNDSIERGRVDSADDISIEENIEYNFVGICDQIASYDWPNLAAIAAACEIEAVKAAHARGWRAKGEESPVNSCERTVARDAQRGEPGLPEQGTASPFEEVAVAFAKLWKVLASLPPEACNDPKHPGWNEPLERTRPLIRRFDVAVSKAKEGLSGVLAPVVGDAIGQAQKVIEELIKRLTARDPRKLPGLLAMDCIHINQMLVSLANLASTEDITRGTAQVGSKVDQSVRVKLEMPEALSLHLSKQQLRLVSVLWGKGRMSIADLWQQVWPSHKQRPPIETIETAVKRTNAALSELPATIQECCHIAWHGKTALELNISKQREVQK